MAEIDVQIAELRTEFKVLKVIVPAVFGFAAVLFFVFWGIERENIVVKVRAAIHDAGVQEALQQLQLAVASSNSDVIKINDILKKAKIDADERIGINNKIKKNNVPVGTIIGSILEPDDDNFLPNSKKQWRLANGDDVDHDTLYYKTIQKEKYPNLQGMFLRGMDSTGMIDRETGREAGFTIQEHSLQDHKHVIGYEYNNLTGPPPGGGILASHSPPAANTASVERGIVREAIGAKIDPNETRPINISVYFYIKIE